MLVSGGHFSRTDHIPELKILLLLMQEWLVAFDVRRPKVLELLQTRNG